LLVVRKGKVTIDTDTTTVLLELKK
jgi:hypothetical protein